MKRTPLALFLLVLLIALSCTSNKKMTGLWQIEKVKIGNQEMTPIARWTKLNPDNTQESGNGWNQHSTGTWEYQSKNKEMNIVNTNGIKDEFGAFKVEAITKEQMSWSRTEENEKVNIIFKRIDKIPQAPANQLLGVWKLSAENVSENFSYLFLRWDRILINRPQNQNRKYAIYKTHGHKQELEIIYYEDPLRQEIWNYQFTERGNLVLTNEVDGVKNRLEYERIDFIPK